ncbi:hypothetical protein GCM10009562_23930 [Nocardioides aquaticus]
MAGKANPALVGWERYEAARIEVTDMKTGDVVPESVGRPPILPHHRGL